MPYIITMLEIILIFIGVLLLGVGALMLIAKFKPELLGPFFKLLMRSKRFRKATGEKIADMTAANPEMLEEVLSTHLGREERKQVEKVLGNRSDAERAELFTKLTDAAQSGRTLRPEDLARKGPRNSDEARSMNKRKSHTRSKNKAARKQRKRSR